MASKDSFSPQEWETLEKSPFWVFTAVAAADGNIDKKEQKAFKRVLQNYTEFHNDLTREILQSAGTSFDEDADYDLSKMEDDLKKVNSILESKVSAEDSLIFKKTMIAIGIHVGNSSGGIFSSKFSDEEVEALKGVGMILGITENQLSQSPSIKELINNMNK